MNSKMERIVGVAMWALRRIERTQVRMHTIDQNNSCLCSQCVATDALEQIKEIVKE